MRSALLATIVALSAACGPVAVAGDRVAVLGVDRLSGELSGMDVELPGADLSAVRGPAGIFLLGSASEGGRGTAPECPLRRRVSGALVARTNRCVTLLGQYAALERARSFLLSAGAEALLPAPVLADASAAPGLHYLPASDAFSVGEGPAGARVPAALNPGAVAREVALRHLRALAETHPEEASGIALFLGAAAAGDAGYLAASDSSGDPTGELDLARPLAAGAPASAVLAGGLWAWADATGDHLGAAKAALAAARAIDRRARPDPATVLSLVAEQLNGAERDQACAVFRARSAGSIAACP